jgi:hypothetical protein
MPRADGDGRAQAAVSDARLAERENSDPNGVVIASGGNPPGEKQAAGSARMEGGSGNSEGGLNVLARLAMTVSRQPTPATGPVPSTSPARVCNFAVPSNSVQTGAAQIAHTNAAAGDVTSGSTGTGEKEGDQSASAADDAAESAEAAEGNGKPAMHGKFKRSPELMLQLIRLVADVKPFGYGRVRPGWQKIANLLNEAVQREAGDPLRHSPIKLAMQRPRSHSWQNCRDTWGRIYASWLSQARAEQTIAGPSFDYGEWNALIATIEGLLMKPATDSEHVQNKGPPKPRGASSRPDKAEDDETARDTIELKVPAALGLLDSAAALADREPGMPALGDSLAAHSDSSMAPTAAPQVLPLGPAVASMLQGPTSAAAALAAGVGLGWASRGTQVLPNHGAHLVPPAPRPTSGRPACPTRAPPLSLGAAPPPYAQARAGVKTPPPRTKWTRRVPPPRTKWTHRVPHPVLIGHAASLTPY